MSPKPEPAQKSGGKMWFRYMDLGMRFALSVFLGVYLGHLADQRWETTPLFLLLGLFLGAGSGFWTIYKVVFPRKTEDDSKTKPM